MIDLHCHAIYDVDDGSKNIEQTIRMLKMAKDVGYDTICFTPHYNENEYKNSKVVIETKLKRIERAIKTEELNINLCLGEEILVFKDLASKLDDVYTLNNSRYLLIEIPLLEEVSYIDDVIDKLKAKGIIPILAHPERYFKTFKNFKYIENLVENGVLLQLNINSLIGHYGKVAQKLALKLIKRDMIAFVATDSHSSAAYYKSKQGLERLKQLVSPEKYDELTRINPEKILKNEEITLNENFSAPIIKKRFFILRKRSTKPIL